MTEPEQWRVVRGEGRDQRTLFVGDETNARNFVETQFPRVHAEPGNDYGPNGPTPDVSIIAPDSAVHTYHGPGEWRDNSETTDNELEV